MTIDTRQEHRAGNAVRWHWHSIRSLIEYNDDTVTGIKSDCNFIGTNYFGYNETVPNDIKPRKYGHRDNTAKRVNIKLN